MTVMTIYSITKTFPCSSAIANCFTLPNCFTHRWKNVPVVIEWRFSHISRHVAKLVFSEGMVAGSTPTSVDSVNFLHCAVSFLTGLNVAPLHTRRIMQISGGVTFVGNGKIGRMEDGHSTSLSFL